MEVKEYFADKRTQRFSKGEVIIRGDDVPSGVYFLESGYVRMSSILSSGSELSVNIFKPGTFFPTIWAIGGVDNTYFFQALTPIVVKKVSKKEFDNFINENPDVMKDLTKRVLIGLDGIVTNFNYVINGNAVNKIASVIAMMVRRFAEKDKNKHLIIDVPLSHQVIASFAGVTRETTSIAIEKLMKDKVIFKSGKYFGVKNLKSLEKYFQ